MKVEKRDGRLENVYFDKITARLEKLCYGLTNVDPVIVAKKVIDGVYDGVRTTDLDTLASEVAASMQSKHYEWGILAARIEVSNLHKQTIKVFSQMTAALYHAETNGKHLPLVSEEYFTIVQEYADVLNSAMIYDRDFDFSYIGIRTLERSYLLRINDNIAERPQHLFMRVAVGIHKRNIPLVLETYEMLSRRQFTHASPTLFHAGTNHQQLSSCFLTQIKDDSLEGIFQTVMQCAMISKGAGGIGLSIHHIRAKGTYIHGTNGKSNGIVPMLQVFNATARYVDQGGGKRPGAFAAYIEPWHADIFEFLDLRKNTGKEEMRARDLFLALWIPDLFMKRVKADGHWTLFSADTAPDLHETFGDEFESLYQKYEKEGRGLKTVPAQKLWMAIIESQIETGQPYMLYKDACNKKSNQQNLGTIKCSNLCTEIVEYTAPDEIAVCNLGSLVLQQFVRDDNTYDFDGLAAATRVLARNLNAIIDINDYPVEEARNSNMRHRPVGIGVQGLADVFMKLGIAYDSPRARELNKHIFECIYYAALDMSCTLAEKDGTYSSYQGSPMSQGKLQFDLWGVKPSLMDWEPLRARIAKFGVRNSLLVAPMPTASTAQIMGSNESTEPFTSNLYTRRVLSGEYMIVNPYLFRELISLGLWNEETRSRMIQDGGSIQNIPNFPSHLKEVYRTVWEIPQRSLLDMAADRGAFIDQSQSQNVFMANPSVASLSSMHFHGWSIGLKTGMYYLRTRPAADAIKFTLDKTLIGKPTERKVECTDEVCIACSS